MIPVNVCIVGHSYSRRFQDFMFRQRHAGYDNLGFDRSEVIVHCVGLGGATVLPGHKCIDSKLPDVARLQPAIVFVHVGENDLGRGTPSQIASALRHFLSQLTPHTHVVFVSQLLLFPVNSNYKESVQSINNNIKCHYVHLPTVTYCRHRGGFWNPPKSLLDQVPLKTLFDADGVHLSQEEGYKAYWRSVRTAVEKGLKMLA